MKVRKPRVHATRVRCLIYGPNRVGKSVLAGSAAALFPTLFCQIDPGGSDSLPAFGYDPDVVDISKPADLEEVFWGMHRRGKEFRHYRALIIDGVGELAKRGLDIAMGSGPSKERSFLSQERFPERRQWGIMTENMRKVIRYFSDLKVHLIWTTTERQFTDQKGNVLKIGPSLSPGLVDDLNNASTLIGYMHQSKKNRSRFLEIGPCEFNDIPVITGNRLGIPEELETLKNPTFKTILDAIQRGKDGNGQEQDG